LSFFVASRRRHTRLVSDWSSDVCSSDLDRLADGDTRRRGWAGVTLLTLRRRNGWGSWGAESRVCETSPMRRPPTGGCRGAKRTSDRERGVEGEEGGGGGGGVG